MIQQINQRHAKVSDSAVKFPICNETICVNRDHSNIYTFHIIASLMSIGCDSSHHQSPVTLLYLNVNYKVFTQLPDHCEPPFDGCVLSVACSSIFFNILVIISRCNIGLWMISWINYGLFLIYCHSSQQVFLSVPQTRRHPVPEKKKPVWNSGNSIWIVVKIMHCTKTCSNSNYIIIIMKIIILLYKYLELLNKILLSKCILLEIKYKKLNAG